MEMTGAVLYGARDLRIQPCKVPELGPGQVLIRVRRAGICGSDLHYFTKGYCGTFVPSRPFILGHEFAGEVVARAADVIEPNIGTRVTVNPARPCGFCNYCRAGQANLCHRTVMLGSASTTPPRDGAFAEFVVAHADQCIPLPPEIDDSVGAIIEPLAVALHALKQVGGVLGQAVFVSGAGPVGLLIAMSAKVSGATLVVISDVIAARRQQALSLGIDVALDATAEDLARQARAFVADGFDVAFEASGAKNALEQAFEMIRPGGTVVQVGTVTTPDAQIPANDLMVRELKYVGCFRYVTEFDRAVKLVANRRLNPQLLISRVFPLEHINAAFEFALSEKHALKVQIEIQ